MRLTGRPLCARPAAPASARSRSRGAGGAAIDDSRQAGWIKTLIKIVQSEVAQWLACWAHNPKVRGSKPRSATFVVSPARRCVAMFVAMARAAHARRGHGVLAHAHLTPIGVATHAPIHNCTHAYIYMHTCIHIYMQAYLQTCMQTCMQTYTHACLR